MPWARQLAVSRAYVEGSRMPPTEVAAKSADSAKAASEGQRDGASLRGLSERIASSLRSRRRTVEDVPAAGEPTRPHVARGHARSYRTPDVGRSLGAGVDCAIDINALVRGGADRD